MSKELAPPESMIAQHVQMLAERLTVVPELEQVVGTFHRDPENAIDVYRTYTSLIAQMGNLDNVELSRIAASQQALQAKGGEVGSASSVGANDIVAALGEKTGLLTEIAEQSVDPQTPYYAKALDTLVTRMQGGHDMRAAGKTPSDHDPASRAVIFGHTYITETETLLHFTICHYLERYFAEALSTQGFDIAKQKDFLINALDDVVILNGLKNPNDTIFKLWSTPRDNGGLGWITSDRLNSYT